MQNKNFTPSLFLIIIFLAYPTIFFYGCNTDSKIDFNNNFYKILHSNLLKDTKEIKYYGNLRPSESLDERVIFSESYYLSFNINDPEKYQINKIYNSIPIDSNNVKLTILMMRKYETEFSFRSFEKISGFTNLNYNLDIFKINSLPTLSNVKNDEKKKKGILIFLNDKSKISELNDAIKLNEDWYFQIVQEILLKK